MSATQQLAEAITNRDAARNTYNTATSAKVRRDAAENLEFWVGKVATLGVMVERGI